MSIKLATPGANDADWIALRGALWPGAPHRDLAAEIADMLERGHFVRVARGDDGQVAGFVEASIRNDYVNGTSTSPVAFLEGLYVVASHRRRGVARELVKAVEAWALAAGCSEFASDSSLANVEAQEAHRALGFQETERVVYFRKRIGQP